MRVYKYIIATLMFLYSGLSVYGQANITRMEYFIDTDPGIGGGTVVPVTLASDITETFILPTSGLPVGFHTVYFRIQDDNNEWSVSESRTFYVSASDLTSQADIIAMEYYFDSDPGFGAATPLGITASGIIDFSSNLDVSALTPGFHTLHVRALDLDGIWGEIESRSFFIDQFGNGMLAGIEYFIDNEPGVGNGSNIDITPAQDTIDRDVSIPMSALSSGAYVVGLRMFDDMGNYGLTTYLNVSICDGATPAISASNVCIGDPVTFLEASTNVVAGDIFSWDVDGDGNEDFNTQGSQTFNYPAAGTYNATLSIDRSGCITSSTVSVIVADIPVADAGIDITSCTDAVTLAGSAPAINEQGTWTILNGAGVLSDVNDPLASLSSITTSTVELEWRMASTVAGCFDSDTVLVTPNLPLSLPALSGVVIIGDTVVFDVHATVNSNSGDVLTTTLVNTPTKGIFEILTGGLVRYIPDPDAAGADQITIRVCNQCGNCVDQTIDITDIINDAPVVTQQAVSHDTQSALVVDLAALISDANGNLDLSTLRIVSQPISGAVASIDNVGILTIDYTGVFYSGTDELSIEICDFSGACTTEILSFDIDTQAGENPPITVYNAVSPNGDGIHDFLEIENIEFYPNNQVFILSRWGSKVASFNYYDNQSNVFDGAGLPAGVYYYNVIRAPGEQALTGHFVLKPDE